MARMWIVVGDTTDSGGRVVTGSPFTSVDGKPVARVTDQAICPKHKGPFPIVDGDATTVIDGQPVALHGSSLACGCKVLAVQQTRAFVDQGTAAGAAAGAAAEASFAPLSSPPSPAAGLASGMAGAPALVDYTLHYHYDDLDKTPVRGVSYRATLADGSVRTGTLDDAGKAVLAQASVGPVEVVYQYDVADDDDPDIREARNALRNALWRIVDQTRQDFADDWKEWNDAGMAYRAFLVKLNQIEGQAKGTWDWASGTVEAVWQLLVLGAKADLELKSLVYTVVTGDWETFDRKIAEYRAKGEQVLGAASEIKEQLMLVFDDQETWDIIAAFPEHWARAVPPDEMAELTSRYGTQFAIDVVISVVLAAFTAGSAGAAYGGAKWTAAIGRLGTKLVKLLDELRDAFKALGKVLKARKRRQVEPPRNADGHKVIESRKKRTPHQGAAFGETTAHKLMTDKGLQPMGKTDGVYRAGEKGIDGVYRNPNPPPEYVITEAKYNKARMRDTKDGPQMSDKWVRNRLDTKVGPAEAGKIRRAMNKGQVEKILIRVGEDGTPTMTRLGPTANPIGPPSF